MANPRRKASGMTEGRRQRAIKALQHRKEGRGYEWIANELGVSVSTAHEDVQKALQEITREPAEEVRQLELERLDQMWLRLNAELARVITEAREGGMKPETVVSSVTKITDSQLRVQERRARLLGLETLKAEVGTDLVTAVRDAFATLDDTPAEELEVPEGEGGN